MPKMMGRYCYRREATDEQRISLVWEYQQLRQLMARQSLYIFNNDRQGELDALWVTEPENQKTAQYGANWGYYVGMDSIRHHFHEAFPADAPHYCDHRPNGTNVIHIAADGLSAFCLLYALENRATDVGAGVRGYQVFSRIWFDMKKENGVWKIWHMLEGNDVSVEAATNAMEQPALALTDAPRPVNPVQAQFGTPDFPITAFDPRFGWYQFPRIPDAHDSYSLDMSCSLEACLQFRAGLAAKRDAKALYDKLGGANA